uniref:ADP,ATP carrier protein n=1 Tax=Ditylum brightwellii TaxID=49249 RepID=A0A7S1ZBM2_9STRA|mmetsp:Transcript_28368/g.42168  ORF Transcript_28368/g.42168 Transcript_28368/m.42168 type:complete len:601 (+) Transcript_28368:98-1900(+)
MSHRKSISLKHGYFVSALILLLLLVDVSNTCTATSSQLTPTNKRVAFPSKDSKEHSSSILGGFASLSKKKVRKKRGKDAIMVRHRSVRPDNIRGGESESAPNNEKQQQQSYLKKIRRTIFPIYGKDEVHKFLLIGSIKFFIIMALTLTRDTKDTMVVTQCGAEAIAFLKIYGVLPAATAFIAFYSKMASIMEKKTLFFSTCIPFFIFFLVFDILIYPRRDSIQPSLSSVQSFMGGATSGGSAVLARIISNWTTALFYIVSEIYSSVSVGVLFWQYANEVVPISQAKRFYPLFAQMSGLAPVVAGQYVVHFASKAKDFESSLHRLTAAVTFAGAMICLFYHFSSIYIEKTEGVVMSSTDIVTAKKKKPKMSMTESAKFLASSQYLRLVAILVLGYGLSINFTDIMWKSLVKKKYPDPLDYQRFMGNFSSAVGLSTCIIIFFGVHIIRILGWRVGALATPGIMAVLAVPFFVCVFMGLEKSSLLNVAVGIGTVQCLLSKTSKYALFDPTTQMAYIPLDNESKVKGKAAIDVLGSRIGKSGGSLIQQGLVFIFGDILSATPAVAILFYSILLGWMSAANKLSGLFLAQSEIESNNRKDQPKGK